jgi:hypothetical protein
MEKAREVREPPRVPVAQKMLLQVAVRDIGQLTDIEATGRRTWHPSYFWAERAVVPASAFP